jgi:soluble P-type ATPase
MDNYCEKVPGIKLNYPDGQSLFLTHLFLDYNGTLANRGKLLPGVKERLQALSHILKIYVLTADTFGTVGQELGDLPIEIYTLGTGSEKGAYVQNHKDCGSIAIGNGKNDVQMFETAQMSIAVLGSEGLSCELIQVASLVIPTIQDALDLLLEPKCLVAATRK